MLTTMLLHIINKNLIEIKKYFQVDNLIFN